MIYLANRVLLNEFLGGIFKRETIPQAKDSRAVQSSNQAIAINRLEKQYASALRSKRKSVETQIASLKTQKNKALSAPNLTPQDKVRITNDIERKMNDATNSIKVLQQQYTKRKEMLKMSFKERMGEYKKSVGNIVNRNYRKVKLGVRKFVRGVRR